jgi:mycoredoxin
MERSFDMSDPAVDKITLYTSRWCAHSLSVKAFLKKNEVPVNLINIDGNSEDREALIQLNGGYASVPTLVFPDGTKLTEPSIGQLRQKLALPSPPGLTERIRQIFGQKGNSSTVGE